MDCARTARSFLGAGAGLSLGLLGLGLFNHVLAPRLAGEAAGRAAGSQAASNIAQQQQAANEKAANDAAKSGTSPSAAAAKVGAEIAGLKAAVAGVNPTADYRDPNDPFLGRVNCQGVSAAVDARLGGGHTDVVAPNFVDSTGKSGAPDQGWMQNSLGNGNTWQSMTPEQIAETLRADPGRGIVYVQWAGGGAHVFNAVNMDGDVFFVEGQTSQPMASSTLDGLYGAQQASGAHDVAFLRTWPPK